MDREGAETHLRLLAEAELRPVMMLPAGSIPGRWYSARLALVAGALIAVGAVCPGVAEQIRAEVGLAVGARHRFFARGPGPGRIRLAPKRVRWRVVPAGQPVMIGDGDLRREVRVVPGCSPRAARGSSWTSGPSPGHRRRGR